MKITENQLKQIIDEEIQAMIESGEIDEGMLDRLKARGAGLKTKIGSAVGAAKQSAGAKWTGAKAAGAEFLGADTKTLRGDQADQQKAAAATKAAGANKAKAQRAASILNSHLKALITDLTKLGVNPDQPDVKKAVAALQQAVNVSTQRAAE